MAFLDNIKQGCLDGWVRYKILPSLTAAQAIL
ncbi:TPA: cell wall hydrolase, partial [Streptococcus equi subsp. ruminatorum]|nr:cell wall hydrolase [Streptococcus equi subsp. ruminatorum]